MQFWFFIAVCLLVDVHANVPGYDSTCTCDSVSSGICMKYTCGISSRPSKTSCFPGRSQVTLPNGRLKQLSQLQIGDLVMVNQNMLTNQFLHLFISTNNNYFIILHLTSIQLYQIHHRLSLFHQIISFLIMIQVKHVLLESFASVIDFNSFKIIE